jgi:putative addiction module CopG family antidote
MNVQLSEELQRFVEAQIASGRYRRQEDVIRDLIEDGFRQRQHQAESAAQEAAPSQGTPGTAHKPIWEEIDEITKGVPDEEWAKMPTDGAEQHDHYIYGTPKRSS